LEDITRRYREAARKESMQRGEGESQCEEGTVEANLWKLQVEVNISIHRVLYTIANTIFKRGRESIVVERLTKWEDHLVSQGHTLHVYHAFIAPLVHSTIYVCTRTKSNILLVCNQIVLSSVRMDKISVVPEEEYEAMKRILREFIPEDWVRIVKGKYRGDVALITDMDHDHRTCKAFYIP